MATIVDGEAVLSHSAQELDDNVDEVVEARGEYESLAEAIEAAGGSYTLPTASASTLGGVKVGSGLSIDANGVLSASGGGGGGGSYTETELLSAPLTGTISSITLNDDMNNYDQLIFRFGVDAEGQQHSFARTVLVSDLNNTQIHFFLDGVTYESGYHWSCTYRIAKATNTTLTVFGQGIEKWDASQVIFSIKGIKY